MTIYLSAIIRTIISNLLFLMAIRTENVATNKWVLLSHQYIEEKNNGHYVLINSILISIKYGNSHKFNDH